MRTDFIACRPDQTLDDTSKETILLIDMTYPTELWSIMLSITRMTRNYIVKGTSRTIECFGGWIKKLRECIKHIFENDNNDREIQKICTMGKKTPDQESITWTVDVRCFDLTKTFW